MRRWICLLCVPCLALVIAGCIWFETETRTDYKPPKAPPEKELTDDRLEDRQPLPFDASLTDRRPLDGWRVNNSSAVFKLDIPAEKPDTDADLWTLHASYASAVRAAQQLRAGEVVLPSLNLLDGKAKQFDDGLYAALDLAYYRGLQSRLRGHVDLIRALLERVGPQSPAVPYLAAGLDLAGVRVSVADEAEKRRWKNDFLRNEALSKPAGFYTWTAELKTCFQFLRFFQREFSLADDLSIPRAIAAALREDPRLQADYQKAVGFYCRLSNPSICLNLTQLPASNDLAAFEGSCKEHGVTHRAVSVFPSSSSRETVLFEKLFAGQLPPDVNLMDTLVRRIRSGEIDLKPGPRSGWYDYQVHALETLLLPGQGEERDKLLLTRNYKKRMLEAFKALLTKRRETHLRQMSTPWALSASPPRMLPKQVSPRLRVEPVPSYYVRTARSYAFLLNFLEATVGVDGLRALHGLREGKPQKLDLHTELVRQRDLFFGLYLISCEDLGLKPTWLAGEEVETEKCYPLASAWLEKVFEEPDLVHDTRVSVPIFFDGIRKKTRLWATLGVRLRHLTASYARPPHIKDGDRDWQEVAMERLAEAHYLICVDEFAEIEINGLRPLTREEFRSACDRGRTREGIVKLLQSWR